MNALLRFVKKTSIVTYEYAYDDSNHGGNITIEFVDGKFSKVNYRFSGTYNREQWKILAEIESKIAEIESFWKILSM